MLLSGNSNWASDCLCCWLDMIHMILPPGSKSTLAQTFCACMSRSLLQNSLWQSQVKGLAYCPHLNRGYNSTRNVGISAILCVLWMNRKWEKTPCPGSFCCDVHFNLGERRHTPWVKCSCWKLLSVSIDISSWLWHVGSQGCMGRKRRLNQIWKYTMESVSLVWPCHGI